MMIWFALFAWSAGAKEIPILPANDVTQRLEQLSREAPKNATLVFEGPHVYEIHRSLKLRADLDVDLRAGAILAPVKSVTVEIQGPLRAGVRRVFSGQGEVVLSSGSVDRVYPQWWGASSDGTHPAETTHALQSAIDSGHLVFIPTGTYLSGELVIGRRGTLMFGENRELSILKFQGDAGSFLRLTAPFMKLADFAVIGTAQDAKSETVGVHLEGGSRSQLVNLRIGGFGYGVRVSKLGGNNLDHCYIYQNRRAGVYLSDGAHGLSITNGTEIADAPYGVVLGRFQSSPFGLDEDFKGVVGQMVSIQGAVIEGIHAVDGPGCKACIGGVGVFSGIGQKGVSITNTYFEDMKAALQLGFKSGRSAVFNTVFRDNFLSDVQAAVKVGRVDSGDISNNHCATVKYLFETSDAGLFQNVKVGGNWGYDALTSHPFSADFGH